MSTGVNWTEVGSVGAIAVLCVGALIWIAKGTVKSLTTSQQKFVNELVDGALANMRANTQAIDAMTKGLQTLATEFQRASAVRDERDKALFELLRDIKTEIRGRVPRA